MTNSKPRKICWLLLLLVILILLNLARQNGILRVPRVFLPSLPSMRVENSTPLLKSQDSLPNRYFLRALRMLLKKRKPIDKPNSDLVKLFRNSALPKDAWGISIVLYQPNKRRLLVLRKAKNIEAALVSALNAVMKHKRFKSFSIDDPLKSRIQIDFILKEPEIIDFRQLDMYALDSRRFEFGVDGLRLLKNGKSYYFLPGDAFVKSVLGMGQLERYLTKLINGPLDTETQIHRFRTLSFVSFDEKLLPLFRGYPVIESIKPAALQQIAEAGINNALRYQKNNGKFMYYYDGASNSYKDHEHPNRDPKKNPYYNIIRHCGGVVMLLQSYEQTHNKRELRAARSALGYMLPKIKSYTLPNAEVAGYVGYNKKAKLGASGVCLYALTEYQRLSANTDLREHADLIARHLSAEIQDSGEFRYYKIYLGKEVSLEENPRFFNFFYPGEAVIGLVGWLKTTTPDNPRREAVIKKLKQALHFLIIERIKKYPQHFQSLPADSWLMMGINELWEALPSLRDPLYSNFVFSEADKMLAQIYNESNALFPDYVGCFYYFYGQDPINDASRAEGITAAYLLAKKTGDIERQQKYMAALKLVALATSRLANIPESVYSLPNPDKALGGIRFKHTRQWFRIDTIQHAVSFYLKFLPHWR